MNQPKISFVCPSYNHAKYINVFVTSLLQQTISDWELIIVDDCSSDGNVTAIKQFSDPRITLIENPFNKGINFGFGAAIERASSGIICLIASDDILLPEYSETVLNIFRDDDVDVVYSPLQHINENGEFLSTATTLPYNKTQEQIFSEMFLESNLLPSPGMAVRKEALLPLLPLDCGLLQHSDWQLHLLLMANHRISLLKKPVVLYRISVSSTSYRRMDVIAREEIESFKLMDTVAAMIKSEPELFERFFGVHPLLKNEHVTPSVHPFWLGRLALTSKDLFKRKWGLRLVMDFIENPDHLSLLHQLYGFSFKDYMALAHLLVEDHPMAAKLLKYKRLVKWLSGSLIISLLILCWLSLR